MKNYSITRRLVFALSVAITIFWVVASAIGAVIMRDEFGEIMDSSMETTAERLVPLVGGSLSLPADDETAAFDDHADDRLTFQVRDETGKVVLRSDDTSATPFPAPLVGGFWEDDTTRIFTLPGPDRSFFVQVGDSLAHRSEAVTESALTLVLPLLFLIPLSIAAVLVIIRVVTAPVTTLRQSIAERGAGNLAPIAIENMPKELKPVAGSINRLLTRLNNAMKAEREFTANSAHELRTPIAGALAHTQLLIGQLGKPADIERARLVEQALTRLAALVEKLLQLSRAEAGIGVLGEETDLLPIIRLVAGDFERAGSKKRIEFEDPVPGHFFRPINPDTFAIVIRNLLENALRHGEGNDPVRIAFEPAAIVISNSARPFSKEELTRIRKRFVRDNGTVSGSGLGLSIVESILSQLPARLDLESRKDAGGDRFLAKILF